MLTASEERELRALGQRRQRAERGRFLAEGIRVVEDLLDSPLKTHWLVLSSSLGDSERGQQLIETITARGLPHRVVPDRDFERLAATDAPQGVLAVAGIPDVTLDGLLADDSPGIILVLDAVQDPGNFGTLVRSAEAFAALGILALPGTVDPWNPKSVRASAGSSFRIPIVEQEWAQAESALRAAGYELLGATGEGEPLGALGSRVALVLGNEGAGLSRPVRESVDKLVGIPTPGRAESLNVAAAAAILLYELSRR